VARFRWRFQFLTLRLHAAFAAGACHFGANGFFIDQGDIPGRFLHQNPVRGTPLDSSLQVVAFKQSRQYTGG